VIYVCENNLYNEYTHNSETLAGDIVTRAPAFGVPGETVDGQDVRKVYDRESEWSIASRQAPARIPVCDTYRFMGITSAISIASTTGPSRKSRCGKPSAIPSSCLRIA
jgi:TPP-dependent pyruvate/acetoin dehydrogenase alpha subunit